MPHQLSEVVSVRKKCLSCSPVLILLMSLLAACSGAASSPASSGLSISPTATPTTSVVNSPLAGTYTTTITPRDVAGQLEFDNQSSPTNTSMYLPGPWVLTFRHDGVWIAQANTDLNNQYIGTGSYQVTGSQVTLVTDSKCLEYYGPEAQSATYAWHLHGTTLVILTASDLCAPRKIVLSSHPWTLQS